MLAAALMAACSSSDLKDMEYDGSETGSAVAFTTYTGHSTRANTQYFVDGQTNTTIPNQQWVGIFAWSQRTKSSDSSTGSISEEWTSWSSDNTFTADFMFNQPAQAQATSNKTAALTYNPIRFWPKDTNRKFAFFAYYPFTNLNNIDADKGNGTEFKTEETGISVPDDQRVNDNKDKKDNKDNNLKPIGVKKFHFKVNPDVTKMVDFLVSDYVINYNGTDEGAVSLNFRHALSMVQVNVNISDEMTKGGVVISNLRITLNGAYSEGDLIIEPNSDGEVKFTDGSAKWDNLSGNTVVFNTPNTALSSTEDTRSSVLLMIPQKLGNGVKITVSYDMDFYKVDSDGNYITDDDGNRILEFSYKDNTVDIPMDKSATDWGAGRRYVYNVLQTTNSIDFSTEVTGWDGTTVEVPVNDM